MVLEVLEEGMVVGMVGEEMVDMEVAVMAEGEGMEAEEVAVRHLRMMGALRRWLVVLLLGMGKVEGGL